MFIKAFVIKNSLFKKKKNRLNTTQFITIYLKYQSKTHKKLKLQPFLSQSINNPTILAYYSVLCHNPQLSLPQLSDRLNFQQNALLSNTEEYYMSVPLDKTNQSRNTFEQSQPTSKNTQLHSYISERVFKDKSDLCRIAIPYILQAEEKPKPKTVKQHIQMTKAQQKRAKYKYPSKNSKQLKANFSYEKAPINEYLNYKLSEEINQHLKEVKCLADEIKEIKQQKKKEIQNVMQKKINNKNIRIRRTNFQTDLKKCASVGNLR